MRGLLFCLITTATASIASADPPHEFIAEAKTLLVVGACAEGTPPAAVKPAIVDAHCKVLKKSQDEYKAGWMSDANAFFAATVPKTVEKELGSLYKSNFSVTMNMIGAMRSGTLPTQLIFSLSALSLHGYEPTSLRYFKLSADGDVQYLTDADVATAEKITDAGARNRQFANVEFRFHKIGSTHEQIYRHILANLDDAHVKKDPSALAHLEKKGHVAAMTKAASYLLTFDEFKQMRQYVIDHVDWMVSDSTGLPPTYGTPAGFEYETYGLFVYSNMAAGQPIAPVWKKMFDSQPKRTLKFRFGYPDGKNHSSHLIIMRRKA